MRAAKSSLRCLVTVTKWPLTITVLTPLLDVGTKVKVLSVSSVCVYTFKCFYLYSLGLSLTNLSWVLLAAAAWDQELYETTDFSTPALGHNF